MTTIYWYAPFDNAGELSLATATAALIEQGSLTVQSCWSRFGVPLSTEAPGSFDLVRDLPEPAGEGGGRRGFLDRGRVARERATLRKRLLQSRRFDLIHLHTYNPFTDWYAIPAIAKQTPFVVQSVHNVRPHERILPAPLETMLLRRGYQACTRLLVAHEHLRDQLVREFDVARERVRVVPLPVLRDAFAPPEHLRTDPVDRGDRLSLLFFGTLRPNKGIDVLLQAIERTKGKLDVRFVFAGRGDPALEELIRRSAATDERIHAEIGFVSNERRSVLWHEADVVVMPYVEFNAQSGVLQDAYATSTPVIVSDVGALGAAVKADHTGWVVKPGDVADLVRVLTHVVGAEAERDAAGAKAHEIADAQAPSAIAELYAELYDELLAHAPVPMRASRPSA